MFGLNKISGAVRNVFTKAQPKTDDAGWTIFGSGINPSWSQGWWQAGQTDPKSVQDNTAVEACVGVYARTIAMLPIQHFKDLPNGGREPVKNSHVKKVLRSPNGYQTRADFMLNLVRSELFTGNGYAVAVRDGDFKISQLHLLPPTGTRHFIDPTDQEIFYHVSGNELAPNDDMLVPARDMLHIRMQTTTDPLRGETPLQSGLLAASAGTSIQQHNTSFFNNMSRPSGTINTDLELDKDQTAALRDRWEQQSSGLNAGKTPILSHGLKWSPLSITATDAEMIEFYKLTVADIARVFGVPQALIGIMDSSTFSNVETLLNMWVSTALGYLVDSIELNLEDLFDLPEDEHINFDLDYMLRGDLQTRMDAYGKGILAGIYSINEARRKEGLNPIDGGDEPRIQQQNVPLTFYEDDLDIKRDRLDLDREVADNNAKSQEEANANAANSDDDNEEVDEPEKSIDILTQIKSAMQ